MEITIIVLSLLSFATLSILLQFVYWKKHVRLARMILRNLKVQLCTVQIRRIHPRCPHYRQCHRLLGLGYVSSFKNVGLFEISLPQTVSFEVSFPQRPRIREMRSCVESALSKSKFRFKNTSSLPSKISYGVRIQGEDTKFLVRFIPLDDPTLRTYRLVVTWLIF